MKTFQLSVPARWVTLLINGDSSGLSGGEVIDAQEFVGVCQGIEVLDIVGEPFVGRFDGILDELVTIVCAEHRNVVAFDLGN